MRVNLKGRWLGGNLHLRGRLKPPAPPVEPVERPADGFLGRRAGYPLLDRLCRATGAHFYTLPAKAGVSKEDLELIVGQLAEARANPDLDWTAAAPVWEKLTAFLDRQIGEVLTVREELETMRFRSSRGRDARWVNQKAK